MFGFFYEVKVIKKLQRTLGNQTVIFCMVSQKRIDEQWADQNNEYLPTDLPLLLIEDFENSNPNLKITYYNWDGLTIKGLGKGILWIVTLRHKPKNFSIVNRHRARVDKL